VVSCVLAPDMVVVSTAAAAAASERLLLMFAANLYSPDRPSHRELSCISDQASAAERSSSVDEPFPVFR